jgi:hypothetical protein
MNGSLLYLGVLLFAPLSYYITAPAIRYRYSIEPLMLIFSVNLIFYLGSKMRQLKQSS